MTFLAYCPHCKKTVSVLALLKNDELAHALENDAEVAVMHTADVDHKWKLSTREKKNLRKAIARFRPS